MTAHVLLWQWLGKRRNSLEFVSPTLAPLGESIREAVQRKSLVTLVFVFVCPSSHGKTNPPRWGPRANWILMPSLMHNDEEEVDRAMKHFKPHHLSATAPLSNRLFVFLYPNNSHDAALYDIFHQRGGGRVVRGPIIILLSIFGREESKPTVLLFGYFYHCSPTWSAISGHSERNLFHIVHYLHCIPRLIEFRCLIIILDKVHKQDVNQNNNQKATRRPEK